MSDLPKLRLGGRTIRLVPAVDVVTWDVDAARHALREAAREWPGRDAVLQLSDATLGPDDDLGGAIEHLARMFDRGQVLAVRLRETTVGVPHLGGDAWDGDAWDSAPLLSDLLPRDGGGGASSQPTHAGSSARGAAASSSPHSTVHDGHVGGSDTAQPLAPSAEDLRATIVTLDGWWETQKVMVFQSARQTSWGPVTVRGILRRVLCTPVGGEVHVIGHADTVGAAADNDALALERARSVHLYLSGDRAGWAEHALAQADVATMQAALRWIGMHSSIACDPGPVDGDWGPATAAGLGALRAAADLPDAGPPNADDWAAIYDAFDQGLAAVMLTDRAGLAAARARIQAIDPASKGETFPTVAPTKDGYASPANRRVDVVFCAAGSIPSASTDDLYDGTFTVDHVAVGPECELELFVTDPQLRPIAGGIVLADVGPLGVRRLIADPRGVVRATVLRGERIRVVHATDSGGSGNVVNHGLRESIAAAEAGAP